MEGTETVQAQLCSAQLSSTWFSSAQAGLSSAQRAQLSLLLHVPSKTEPQFEGTETVQAISALLCSAQLSSPQLSSVQLGSAQLSALSSAQLCLARLSSIQLSSVQLSSAQLASAQSFQRRRQTLNGHSPPKQNSDRLQSLPKRVSDDPLHSIFRRPECLFTICSNIFCRLF